MCHKVYHFVSTFETKEKILRFANLKKWNFSKTIRFILDTVIPVVNFYTYFEEESGEFGYKEFGPVISEGNTRERNEV